jgi:hypothetical protein
MNTETLKLPHGYRAEIAIEDYPLNPFEDFETMPIAVFDDAAIRHPARKGSPIDLPDLFDLLPASFFETPEGRAKICDASGVDPDELPDMEPDASAGEWRDAIRDALPEAPCGWGSAVEYFECMEAVAALAGVPCHRGRSTGYSQGDSALVFAAATPAWREEVGAPDDCADQCKGVFDLYSAWAWGDVYGAASIHRPDDEDVPDASCWGFYGSDHEASGLLEHCRDMVEVDRRYLAKEARESMDAACRDIATV